MNSVANPSLISSFLNRRTEPLELCAEFSIHNHGGLIGGMGGTAVDDDGTNEIRKYKSSYVKFANQCQLNQLV